MTDYRHEAVEVCPHCMGENTVPDWAPEDGWRTTCKLFFFTIIAEQNVRTNA